MQIVIDIPDHIYRTLIETGKYGYYAFDAKKAIKNGIPLERYEYRKKMFSYLDGVADGLNESSRDTIDVLDKIRAEIMSKDGLEEALEIIDKYKTESEDK